MIILGIHFWVHFGIILSSESRYSFVEWILGVCGRRGRGVMDVGWILGVGWWILGGWREGGVYLRWMLEVRGQIAVPGHPLQSDE